MYIEIRYIKKFLQDSRPTADDLVSALHALVFLVPVVEVSVHFGAIIRVELGTQIAELVLSDPSHRVEVFPSRTKT